MHKLIPALIIAKVYQTEGISGVKRIMNYIDFKTAVQKEFSKQSRASFTKFVNQLVEEYVDPGVPIN